MKKQSLLALAASAAMAAQLLSACGGADQCEAASDYVWLVDYGAGQHGGPPDDARSGIRLAERLLESIDDLDRAGPDSLDDDLDRSRTVWEISRDAFEADDPERIPAEVEADVPGGAAAAQESGRAITDWARKTCGDDDSFPGKPDGFAA